MLPTLTRPNCACRPPRRTRPDATPPRRPSLSLSRPNRSAVRPAAMGDHSRSGLKIRPFKKEVGCCSAPLPPTSRSRSPPLSLCASLQVPVDPDFFENQWKLIKSAIVEIQVGSRVRLLLRV